MLVFSFSGEPQSLSRQIRVRARRRGEKPRQGQTWAAGAGGGEEKTDTVTQTQTKQPGLGGPTLLFGFVIGSADYCFIKLKSEFRSSSASSPGMSLAPPTP